MNPKVSFGAEITVTAGEVGVGRGFDTGIEVAPVLSFVKGKGLYGGIQLDGKNGRWHHLHNAGLMALIRL
jgi:lipid-binding SYLF domain-containing protein